VKETPLDERLLVIPEREFAQNTLGVLFDLDINLWKLRRLGQRYALCQRRATHFQYFATSHASEFFMSEQYCGRESIRVTEEPPPALASRPRGRHKTRRSYTIQAIGYRFQLGVRERGRYLQQARVDGMQVVFAAFEPVRKAV
jgi:hypothetical protein